MANGIEEFSESKNLARVASGLKGGPFFNNPVKTADRTIVEGVPPTVLEKLNASSTSAPKPTDPWNQRR